MEKNNFKAKNYRHQRLIIDSSIILKYFLDAEYDEQVSELIKLHKNLELTLIAPPLLKYEVLNVLSKKHHDFEGVKEAYNKFESIGIILYQPTRKYENLAIKYATENPKISYYDASYHTLAKEFDTTFITADQKYYEQAKSQGNIELFNS